MHIAVITAYPPSTRTLNEYGFHLVKALAHHPEVSRITILADEIESTAPAPLPEGNVVLERCWRFNAASNLRAIPAALKRHQPDLAIYNLHMSSFGDKEIPAALSLLTPQRSHRAGIPSGVIAHNLFLGVDLENTMLKGQKLRQKLVRLGGAAITKSLLNATYMTVTLKTYAETLAQTAPKADVTLVPHGSFEDRRLNIPKVSSRPETLVTMGKFGTYKRVDTLVAAFEKLKANPDFAQYRLSIGGTDHPNAQGYLASIARDYAHVPGLEFHGYVAEEDVAGFFMQARACVFDYQSTTGSSGVLHQAADYGTVPIFPAIGDFCDVAEEEDLKGYNFTACDTESLYHALVACLSDTNEMDAIAAHNVTASAQIPMSAVADWHVQKAKGTPPTLHASQ